MFGNLLKGVACCATLSLATVGALTFVPDESWEHFPEALAPTRAQLAEFGIAPIKYRTSESQAPDASDSGVDAITSNKRLDLTNEADEELSSGAPRRSIVGRTAQNDAAQSGSAPSSVRIRDRIASADYVVPSEPNAASGAYDVQALNTLRSRRSQNSSRSDRQDEPTSPSLFKGIASPQKQELAEQETPKQDLANNGPIVDVFQSPGSARVTDPAPEAFPEIESSSNVGVFQNEFFADESSDVSGVKQNDPLVAQKGETQSPNDVVAQDASGLDALDYASQQEPIVQALATTSSSQTASIVSNDQATVDPLATSAATTAEFAAAQTLPPLERQELSTQLNSLEQYQTSTLQQSLSAQQQDATSTSQPTTAAQDPQELVQTTIPAPNATQAFVPQTSATSAQPSVSLDDALQLAERAQTDEQARDVFFVLNQYRRLQGTTLPEAELVRLNAALDRLAYDVFYNPKRSILESPRQIAQGETLASIAQEYQVTPELLAAINGLQLAPDAPLTPGTFLKVARGPVTADASVSKKELTLNFNGLYAGRFKFGVPQQALTYRGLRVVETKIPNPSCDAVGVDGVKTTIPGGAENNPLGSCWIGLNGGMGLQGTNRPELIGTIVSENGGYLFSNNEISQLEILLPIGAAVSFSD